MWKTVVMIVALVIIVGLVIGLVIIQSNNQTKVSTLENEKAALTKQSEENVSKLAQQIAGLQDKLNELQKENDKLANVEHVQEGRHKITVKKLFFSEEDFHRNTFGNVLGASFSIDDITLPEGKQRIFPDPAHAGAVKYQYEGSLPVDKHGEEWVPPTPISFEIDYSRNSEYVLKISEYAIIATTSNYVITKRMSEGYWLLDGKVKIGKSSWIEFLDEKVK